MIFVIDTTDDLFNESKPIDLERTPKEQWEHRETLLTQNDRLNGALTQCRLQLSKLRDLTGCPPDSPLELWLKAMMAENGELKTRLSSLRTAAENVVLFGPGPKHDFERTIYNNLRAELEKEKP